MSSASTTSSSRRASASGADEDTTSYPIAATSCSVGVCNSWYFSHGPCTEIFSTRDQSKSGEAPVCKPLHPATNNSISARIHFNLTSGSNLHRVQPSQPGDVVYSSTNSISCIKRQLLFYGFSHFHQVYTHQRHT